MSVANNHNISLLYRYLRLLHVQVDRGTVARLLSHPLGNSLRGLSDALDALGVRNAAYQLPPEYFDKLEAPFIALTHRMDDPFCLVEQKEGARLVVYARGRRMEMEREAFVRGWTGGVLMGEVDADTRQDPWYRLKDFGYALQRYSLPLAGLLAVGWMLVATVGTLHAALLAVLAVGVFVSAAVLYKERVDSGFLHRFCHMGQAVDCNTVLHSRGARLAGIGLGEWSLFYFLTLLLLAWAAPPGFLPLAAVCGAGALAFTVYSVFYQVFVVKKGCMLCMAINIVVWAGCLLLFLLWRAGAETMPALEACALLVLSAGIALGVVVQVRKSLRTWQERIRLGARLVGLFTPQAFRALQALEPRLGELPAPGLCLHNGRTGSAQVLVVTNPTCKNCARLHPQVEELASQVPLSLLLLTFPGSQKGKQVAQTVLAAYRTRGWQQALEVLTCWYERGELPPDAAKPEQEDADRWERQQLYGLQQQLNKTPWVVVDNRPMPEVYEVRDLKYVLT